MNNFDFIIIGSGVSGMSFAFQMAKQNKSVLVLEKKEYAGGCLRSLRHEDFWLELGGHTVYRSYKTFIETLRALGQEDKFLPRGKAGFKMFEKGEIQKITSKLNKAELVLNLPKMFFSSKDGKTVREYYSSFLGKGNYDNVFYGMFQAVISQDASDFPADTLFKKRDKDKTAPKNFTLQNGMSTYIDAISELENVTVMTDSEAVDISFSEGMYTVETAKGDKYTAQGITMACPPPVAGKLLSKAAPEAAEILSEIKGKKIETMGVVVNKADMDIAPFSFIVAADDDFTSAVSRDILPHDKYRGVAFHFRAGALDKEAKIAMIEDVLGIDRGAIVASAETIHFSPTLGLDHKEKLEKLEEAVAKYKGLKITGNYFGGLALEDCVLRSVSQA